MGAGACEETDDFTAEEWRIIEKLEPLKGAQPRNPFNDYGSRTTSIAKLGQLLFFDKDVAEAITVAGPSGTVGEIKKVACVNCHDTKYFADSPPDARVVSPRAQLAGHQHRRDGQPGLVRVDPVRRAGSIRWSSTARASGGRRPRRSRRPASSTASTRTNTTGLRNFPDSRRSTTGSARGAAHGHRTDPTHRLSADRRPQGQPEGGQRRRSRRCRPTRRTTSTRFGPTSRRAFDTYPRMLTTPDSPFQRYVRDRKYDALSPQQKRGLQAVHRQGRLQRLPHRADADRQQVPQHRGPEPDDASVRDLAAGAQPRAWHGDQHQPPAARARGGGHGSRIRAPKKSGSTSAPAGSATTATSAWRDWAPCDSRTRTTAWFARACWPPAPSRWTARSSTIRSKARSAPRPCSTSRNTAPYFHGGLVHDPRRRRPLL